MSRSRRGVDAAPLAHTCCACGAVTPACMRRRLPATHAGRRRRDKLQSALLHACCPQRLLRWGGEAAGTHSDVQAARVCSSRRRHGTRLPAQRRRLPPRRAAFGPAAPALARGRSKTSGAARGSRDERGAMGRSCALAVATSRCSAPRTPCVARLLPALAPPAPARLTPRRRDHAEVCVTFGAGMRPGSSAHALKNACVGRGAAGRLQIFGMRAAAVVRRYLARSASCTQLPRSPTALRRCRTRLADGRASVAGGPAHRTVTAVICAAV